MYIKKTIKIKSGSSLKEYSLYKNKNTKKNSMALKWNLIFIKTTFFFYSSNRTKKKYKKNIKKLTRNTNQQSFVIFTKSSTKENIRINKRKLTIVVICVWIYNKKKQKQKIN